MLEDYFNFIQEFVIILPSVFEILNFLFLCWRTNSSSYWQTFPDTRHVFLDKNKTMILLLISNLMETPVTLFYNWTSGGCILPHCIAGEIMLLDLGSTMKWLILTKQLQKKEKQARNMSIRKISTHITSDTWTPSKALVQF